MKDRKLRGIGGNVLSFVFVSVAGLLWICPSSGEAAPDTVIVEQSIVEVCVQYKEEQKKWISCGTGFVINDQGHIVTNNHVVDKPLPHVVEVLYKHKNSVEKFVSGVLWKSARYDLAVVHSPNIRRLPISISLNKPEKNEPVSAVGFPGVASTFDKVGSRDDELEATWTAGVVGRVIDSSWANAMDGTIFTIVQHSADINQGNSGGPLLNDCGYVIGVNTMGLGIKDGIAPSGVFFSSHSTAIAQQLKTLNIPFIEGTAGCGSSHASSSSRSSSGDSYSNISKDAWDADYTPSATGSLDPNTPAPKPAETSKEDDWDDDDW